MSSPFHDAWFLGGDTPGVAISGDSGCGKTSTTNYLLSTLARRFCTLTPRATAFVRWVSLPIYPTVCERTSLFSVLPVLLKSSASILSTLHAPHGDGSERFAAVWGLHPEEFHEVVIHGRLVKTPRWQQPFGADYHYTGRVNKADSVPSILRPVHAWCREEIDDQVKRLSHVTAKVADVVRILLEAWGEADLHSRPRLFTWFYRILKTLTTCGMSISGCRYFFLGPRGPICVSINRTVSVPLATRAFEGPAGRRPVDADEQVESCRTRLLGFCESVAVELLLGRTRPDVLDMRQFILQGKSLLVDLRLRGTLRDEVQAVFANLFVTDFLHAVMHLPAEQRRLFVLCLDELPVFANNGPLLMRSVREVRQFPVRYIFAFQGKDAFDRPPSINLVFSQLAGKSTKLSFTAKGDAGGEKVEVKVGGTPDMIELITRTTNFESSEVYLPAKTVGHATQQREAIDWRRPLTWAATNLTEDSDGVSSALTSSSGPTPNSVSLERKAATAYHLFGEHALRASRRYRTMTYNPDLCMKSLSV